MKIFSVIGKNFVVAIGDVDIDNRNEDDAFRGKGQWGMMVVAALMVMKY